MAKLVERIYAVCLLLFGPALVVSVFAFGNNDKTTGFIAALLGIALLVGLVVTRAAMGSA